jgi:hypothetical protein
MSSGVYTGKYAPRGGGRTGRQYQLYVVWEKNGKKGRNLKKGERGEDKEKWKEEGNIYRNGNSKGKKDEEEK